MTNSVRDQVVRHEGYGAEEQHDGEEEQRDMVACVGTEGGDGYEVEEDADYGCDEEGLADGVEWVAAVWQSAFGCAVHL